MTGLFSFLYLHEFIQREQFEREALEKKLQQPKEAEQSVLREEVSSQTASSHTDTPPEGGNAQLQYLNERRRDRLSRGGTRRIEY